MFNIDLLEELLVIAISLSTITCAIIQKTKRFFNCSDCLTTYSFFINIIMSIIFCMTFTKVNFPTSLWVGLFSFLGADTIFKSLEGKLVSYRDIVEEKYIKVPKSNIIERGK